VTTIKNMLNRQPLAASDHTENWQTTLWREWRNCEDVEYARHLFDLVVDQPTDRWATMIFVFLSAILGAIGGWLLALLLYPDSLNAIAGGTLTGIAVGLIVGLLVMLGLGLTRRASWGIWLNGLTPNRLVEKTGGMALNAPYFRLAVALGSGLGVGMTGAFFFGQPNPHFYFLLLALVILLILDFSTRQWSGLMSVLGGIVGWLLGLFFGLGLAQLVGLFITPLDVANSGRVVGLAVGAGAGLFLGRKAGLIGVLAGQVVITGLVMAAGLNLVLLGWLVGLLIGGVAAAISRMFPPASKLNFYKAYSYRVTYLWWLGRPPATMVEATLRQYASGQIWQKLFRDLEKQQKQPETAEPLWAYLRKPNWVDHFIGRHTLVALGGEAIPHLLTKAKDRAHPLRRTATWLIRSICHETNARLAGQADRMLCPTCLTCCGSHTTTQLGSLMIYYGCRTCGQSREFIYCQQGVMAVLDSNWTETPPQRGGLLHRIFDWLAADRPELEAQAQDDARRADGLLRVNWLAHRELFDFDRVEIVQATDEDVERFAVQVGNDTDPMRKPRYPGMECSIWPECQLSENTLRVLQHTFGQVEYAPNLR
jgi:hypothetical protein